jgi:hypothetical protein
MELGLLEGLIGVSSSSLSKLSYLCATEEILVVFYDIIPNTPMFLVACSELNFSRSIFGFGVWH